MVSKATGHRRWMPTSQMLACRKLADGRFIPAETAVIIEKELRLIVNRRHLVTASITPSLEREFVIGYLFGQGFINNLEDVTSVDIQDNTARVRLAGAAKLAAAKGASYRIVSGGGRVAYIEGAELPEIKSRMQISQGTIFKAMSTLFETARIYRETEGVHAAGLFTASGSLICIVEDIGRHNSLDKVIGYALINKVDRANAFLVSTGRMASEMVVKICRAGIPLAATKTAVTDKGVEIARKHGMTVIGFVRDIGMRINTDMEVRATERAGMKIYTGADRVPCA